MRDIILPEFNRSATIAQQRALIFDNINCKYDLILGTNFLSKIGMKLNYENGQMEWFDSCIPMRAHSGLTSVNFDDMSDNDFIQLEDTIFGEDWLDSFATEILNAKYELTDVASVVNTLDL